MANDISALLGDIDLTQATKVETIYNRTGGQKYDMAYSQASKKFRLSKDAWAKLGMDHNGFDMKVLPNGVVLLALVPEGDATMYGRRSSNGTPMGKGEEATNRRMREYLNKLLGEDVNYFALQEVGQQNGVRHFAVTPWEDEKGSTLAFTGGNTPQAAATPAAQTEAPQAAPQTTAPAETPQEAPATTPAPEAQAPAAEEALDFDTEETAPAAAPQAEEDPFKV